MAQSLLVLSGEVDEATRTKNQDAVEQFMETADDGVWVVDLADVSFMDSSGLGLLIAVRSQAQARGASVTLRHPSVAVFQLLTITGLVPLFDVDPA